MFLLLFLVLFIREKVISFEFSYSKANTLIYEKDIRENLENIFNDKEKINIINNPNKKWFEDCFEIYCYNNNLKYDIISYKDLYNNRFSNQRDIIFVNDFLVDYGRIIKEYEKKKLFNYKENPKILLNINNYEDIILKDNKFIDNFKMHKFPLINKRHINNFIFNLIDYYDYDNDLHLFDWKKLNLENLTFRDIENLVYSMHRDILKEKKFK